MKDYRVPLTALQKDRLEQLRLRDERGLPVPIPHSITALLRMRGLISESTLQRALSAVAERQAALRARICANDPMPHQVIESRTAQLDILDPPGDTADQRRAAALQLFHARSRVEFDPAGPMLDVTLMRITDDESMLLLCCDQLVSDLWSLNVLVADLGSAYSAATTQSVASPPLPIDYAQAVEEDLAWLDSPAGLAARERCRHLALAAEQVALPRPANRDAPAQHLGTRTWSTCGPAFEALSRACRKGRSTVATAVLAALGIATARRLGCAAAPVLVLLNGRDRPEVQSLAMWRSNTLPVPVPAEPRRALGDLIRDVQRASFLALENQRVPWPVVADDQGLSNYPDGRSPIEVSLHYVPHVLTGQNAAKAFHGLKVTPEFGRPCPVNTAIDVQVVEEPGGISGRLQFRQDLVEPHFVDAVLTGLEGILAELATQG